MLEQKHNEEQNADAANSQPAYCKTDVSGTQSDVSPEYCKQLEQSGFVKSSNGAFTLCHNETEYRFYLSRNNASARVVWKGCPMPSLFHNMSVDSSQELDYLIKNVLIKIQTFMAKAPTDI